MPLNRNTSPLKTLDATSLAAWLLLAAAFLMGGASRENELRVALIELAALPLLLIATTSLLQTRQLSGLAIACLVALVGLPLLQLIPLPPFIWSALPGREPLALALNLVGEPLGWTSMSMAPDRTWRSVLALIPPIAMFLGFLATDRDNRRRLFYGVMAVTALSILIGAVQLASGGNQFYPWRTTDWPSMVGLFANRNHLATLCLISIPIAVAVGSRRLGDYQGRLPGTFWAAAILLALTVIAIGVIRSRAGVVLFMPVLGASVLAGWIAMGRGRPTPVLLGIVGTATVALIAVGAFALRPILDRFDTAGVREWRYENWPLILDTASNYLPFGSGIGSFDAVFRAVEPWQELRPTFFNQAHNEYLETWIEAGWFGAAAFVLFAVWFTRRAWSAWRAQPSTARDLQRASSIGILAVLLHSGVDYPLRTLTIAVVFAILCAALETGGRPGSGREAQR